MDKYNKQLRHSIEYYLWDGNTAQLSNKYFGVIKETTTNVEGCIGLQENDYEKIMEKTIELILNDYKK